MALAKLEREMAARGEGCLGKAADDEPVFILRGNDVLAGPLVRMWVELARLGGCDQDKLDEANDLAEVMEEWPTRKWPD